MPVKYQAPQPDTQEEREALFTALYKNCFPLVARYVCKMGGSFDEAKDVFQDAVIAYYEKTVQAKTAIHSSEKAYLLGIAKYLWIKKHNDKIRSAPLEMAEDQMEETDKQQHSTAYKLLKFMETAGQRCMELLSAFYYDKAPLQEITGKFGYRSVRSATVQKFKCLEKLRDSIKDKNLQYEDFLD